MSPVDPMSPAPASKPLLIALCSPRPQMGKSTVSDHLVGAHGFVRLKFAEPLKNMIRTLLRDAGVPPMLRERYVDGDLKEAVIPELGVTSRHLQQTLGTEWGRDKVRQDLWVHITKLKVERAFAEGRSVVIDDMRFINELEMVRGFGGEPVRVNRGAPIQGRISHRSEGELNRFMFRDIWNNSDIKHLQIEVDLVVAALR